MRPVYEGSVKTVFRDTQRDDVNYFRFSNDYSIFDWGKMPDTIEKKGYALSLLGGYFFQQLENPESWSALKTSSLFQRFDQAFLNSLFQSTTYQSLIRNGLRHHFLGWVNSQGQPLTEAQLSEATEPPLLKVRSIEVNPPAAFTLDQYSLFDYSRHSSSSKRPQLIPLEVVFRFGMPEGSSLEARLNQDDLYFHRLGLSEPPVSNRFFERPVIECFTKLEPTDRFLTPQEALTLSGLTGKQFALLYDTTLLLSLWLYDFFAKHQIELWDGKFEFAWSPDEGLLLVDSIGPDELRLKYEGVHLSKEVIRQFYRNTPWEKAVREAKQLAKLEPGADWKAICENRLGMRPDPLTPSQKQVVDSLYGALANLCLERPRITTTLDFQGVISALKSQQTAGVH